MATAQRPKVWRVTYEETEAYRRRAEERGLVRMVVGIDGKGTRGEFSHRIDEATAWKTEQMIGHMLKGLSPVVAFRMAFAEDTKGPTP